jgi:F420-dependent oxidoreductase-like protein
MRLRIFTEPQQGASYATLRRGAQATEDLGFDGFFRSDHYLNFGPGSGEPGPSDAWVTLAGLAVETRRIRLGTLVTSATFRYPGPLAIAIAGIDEMSGGRIELGLGAGWNDREHTAYGIPFPGTGERFDRLEEQLAIITGLWQTPPDQKFSYSGRHYQLTDSPALPKPVQQPRPPVIVGGYGQRRTPALAAKYADEFNIPFSSAGRDPATLSYSVAQTVCCAKDPATLARRAAAIGRDLDELRANAVAGSPAELADRIGAFAAVGAQVMYLQVLDLSDLDQLADIADQVLPQV